MCIYLARVLTLSVPGPCEKTDALFWPVFVIATIAAMVASQAMISATFSCVKQSMALGCFPRLKIVHTSKRLMGQIYIPVMNWFLMIMCIAVVSIFRSTTDIANAYGEVSSSYFSSWNCLLRKYSEDLYRASALYNDIGSNSYILMLFKQVINCAGITGYCYLFMEAIPSIFPQHESQLCVLTFSIVLCS